MSVDRTEVERIAQLARLKLSDAESDRLTLEMNQILEHAMRLRRSAAATREATSAATKEAMSAETVPDEPSGTRAAAEFGPDRLERDLTDFAPNVVDGFFVVPPPPGVSAGSGGSFSGDSARVDRE